ncbi:MAG: 6,7-dimethyl-8-ribityllumazine synthase, partial [Actinomycetota bacterium]|nr:6,7-dimethyl-8-ribityllumazine synthase [Actinomycetota bacterium]
MGKYAALEGDLDATGMRFAIVAARFNHEVTEPLCAGAEKKLWAHGAE